jgi:hypothetical protein
MPSNLSLSTVFEPRIHGFQFSNDDIEWEWGPIVNEGGIRGKNLCGGMVYAAKDSFFYGRPIPRTAVVPALRTTLNEYIYKRQKSAHWGTVPKFLTGFSWFVDSVAGEFDKIRKEIAVGAVMPLFLVKEGTMHGHRVLVIGCESSPSLGSPHPSAPTLGNIILDVYDPNYPAEITSIAVKHSDKRFTLVGPGGQNRGNLKGFFVDGGYSPEQPYW